MKPSDLWLLLLGQALLRGMVWMLFLMLMTRLAHRASAARRALVWQMGFLGLVLLPLLLFCLPPLPLMQAVAPAVVRHKGVSVGGHATPTGNGRVQPVVLDNGVPGLPRSAIRTVARSNSPFLPIAAGRVKDVPVSPAAKNSAGTLSAIGAGKPRPVFVATGVKWLLFIGWAVGALWSLLSLTFSLAALHRLSADSIAASPELVGEMRDSTDRLGLSRFVTLRVASLHNGLQAPVTWGVVRPVVMLPLIYATASIERRRVALLHELAHVKRGDWAWLVVAQVVCALYWCVPFVWIALRGLRRDTEIACDDCVLINGVSAPEYAAQILEVARLMKMRNAHPGSALMMACPPLAESRIRAILDSRLSRQPVSWTGLALAALLPAVCAPLLSLRAVAASKTFERHRLASIQPEIPESAPPSVPALTPDPLAGPTLSALPLNSMQQGKLPHLWAPGGDPTDTRPTSEWIAVKVADNERTVIPALLPAASRGPRTAVQRDGQAEAAPPIAWGAAADGLQAGLRLVNARPVFAPGEIVWQEAYLRNRSSEEVVVTAAGGYEEQGAPVITNSRRGMVKVLRFFGRGAMFTVSTHVRPGEIALVGRLAVAFYAPGKGAEYPHEVAAGLSSSAEGTALVLAGPGTYMLRQEITPFSVNDKVRKKLTTGPIALKIAGESIPIAPVDRNSIMDVSNAPIAWGKVQSGLQAGLIALGTKSAYYIGERVRVAVVLRNVSDKPISFWHETSFAFLEPPSVIDAGGRKRLVKLASEPEWRSLGEIRMTGVTFDMTFAPSADGPSRLRQTEIKPGQSVIGYYLTAFVPPSKWPDGRAVPGRYQVVQPVRLGLGDAEQLDTSLATGSLDFEIRDPDVQES